MRSMFQPHELTRVWGWFEMGTNTGNIMMTLSNPWIEEAHSMVNLASDLHKKNVVKEIK